MSLLAKIENFFKTETSAAQTALAPLEAELKVLAVQDLKDILADAVSAVEAGIAAGGTTPAALIAAAIAAVKTAAEQKGIVLAETAATGLGAALVSGVNAVTTQAAQ